MWLVVGHFLGHKSFVLAAVHGKSDHNITINLQQDIVIFCSATFNLYLNGKVLYF